MCSLIYLLSISSITRDLHFEFNDAVQKQKGRSGISISPKEGYRASPLYLLIDVLLVALLLLIPCATVVLDRSVSRSLHCCQETLLCRAHALEVMPELRDDADAAFLVPSKNDVLVSDAHTLRGGDNTAVVSENGGDAARLAFEKNVLPRNGRKEVLERAEVLQEVEEEDDAVLRDSSIGVRYSAHDEESRMDDAFGADEVGRTPMLAAILAAHNSEQHEELEFPDGDAVGVVDNQGDAIGLAKSDVIGLAEGLVEGHAFRDSNTKGGASGEPDNDVDTEGLDDTATAIDSMDVSSIRSKLQGKLRVIQATRQDLKSARARSAGKASLRAEQRVLEQRAEAKRREAQEEESKHKQEAKAIATREAARQAQDHLLAAADSRAAATSDAQAAAEAQALMRAAAVEATRSEKLAENERDVEGAAADVDAKAAADTAASGAANADEHDRLASKAKADAGKAASAAEAQAIGDAEVAADETLAAATKKTKRRKRSRQRKKTRRKVAKSNVQADWVRAEQAAMAQQSRLRRANAGTALAASASDAKAEADV